MPNDPWAAFETVAAPTAHAAGDDWSAFEPIHAPTPDRSSGNTLSRATGISETPWYARGIFAGYGPSVTDVVDTLPAVGGAIGGAMAAGAGLASGSLGALAIPGAAALGGEAGEAARQNVRRAIGAYAPRTSGEAAKEIGQQGGIQAAAEIAGRVIPVAAGKAVETFLPAAEKQYAQALGATTVANKQISEKIVPQLIERGVHGSRERIAELAEQKVAETGARMDTALANMPKGQAANTSAVVNQLQSLKRQYVVPSGTPGTNVIVDKAAYDNLGQLQKLVASTEPTFESVRRLRQILDAQVTAGDKAFGRTMTEGTKLDATREAANAIRAELAKVNPDLAKINREFSFWKDVDRVMSATNLRTSSQAKPLGQTIAESVASPAVAGAAASGAPTVAATVAIPVLLRRLVQSPQWRTFSAIQKDRLADAIARGDAQRIGALLGHSMEGLREAVSTSQDGPEGTTR